MKSNKVSSGIKELDKIIGGGYYPGYVVLLAGHPGAGKTTFAASFLYYGAKSNEPGVCISFAERKEEFYRHMKSFKMDFEELERQGKFKFIDAMTFASKDYIDELIKTIARSVYDINAKRVVIDSISALYHIIPKNIMRAFMHSILFTLLKPLGIVTYLIVELPLGTEVVGYGYEEFLADVVLKLIV